MATKEDDVAVIEPSGVNIETYPVFDIAAHLDSPEVVAAYLSEFFAEGDPAMIASALNDAARATGMPEVAAKSGLAREALYKALRPGSQPRMETILRVLRALGFQLAVQPILNIEKPVEDGSEGSVSRD
jgi:probable addiction module antidote protein